MNTLCLAVVGVQFEQIMADNPMAYNIFYLVTDESSLPLSLLSFFY